MTLDPKRLAALRQLAEECLLVHRSILGNCPERTLAEGTVELLEALTVAEGQLAEKERDIGPPGAWVCPTCGFVLMKMLLRAADMAVGIDARPVEDICPNDGASMRQKTWKEDAHDSDRVGREQMQRAEAVEAKLALCEHQKSLRLNPDTSAKLRAIAERNLVTEARLAACAALPTYAFADTFVVPSSPDPKARYVLLADLEQALKG